MALLPVFTTSTQFAMQVDGKVLALMVESQPWQGTLGRLAEALGIQAKLSPRLGIWLRRNEPMLWWTHGISVRFSRTGRRRLVHLARRPSLKIPWLEQAAVTANEEPAAVTNEN